MATLSSRRSHTTLAKGKEPDRRVDGLGVRGHEQENDNEHEHENDISLSHSHSHSHSVLGLFGHAHTHGKGGTGDADKVVAALSGAGDRGSQITLVGLASNVGLTVSKGVAGWYMNSVSLLADAGHIAGDIIGDVTTLYPYGFGKFEVIGTAAVSLLLTGGALGLGLHSLLLLVHSLSHTAATLPAGALQEILVNVTEVAQNVSAAGLDHGHSHGHTLDPNAAWFAAIGVLAKELLYRTTKKFLRALFKRGRKLFPVSTGGSLYTARAK
ncbi:hypothetical protein BC835DRAFT_1399089 [Cytidiella melzeri]|nr:hypothetical protein BC835DRAFT_1399089 [Cytidiella melzeri]